MKHIHRLVTFGLTLVIGFIAYNFWVGSGIFDGLFLPSPPEGFDTLQDALRAGNPSAVTAKGVATASSKGVELLLTILTTVGTIFAAIFTKLIPALAKPLIGLIGDRIEPQSSQQDKPSGLSPKAFRTYMDVLTQAILDGDPVLCEAMANKLHGKTFVKCTKVTEGGFPE